MKYQSLKFCLMLLALCMCLVSISFTGFTKRPKGFTVKKIQSFHKPCEKWDVSNEISTDSINKILEQPFTYLGSGNHCYAFLSDDSKYVLKFFKQKHMSKRIWQNYLPLPEKMNVFRASRIKKHQKEREKAFSSYKLAYEHLKEETEIVYMHLNKTTHLKKPLHIIDQHGTTHQLNADNLEFLLQKKADVGYTLISKLMKQSKLEEATDKLISFLEVVVKRAKKGIFDRDIQFYKNFGFINGKAVEIDIGEFKYCTECKSSSMQKNELLAASEQIKEWLHCNYPNLEPKFQEKVEEILNCI